MKSFIFSQERIEDNIIIENYCQFARNAHHERHKEERRNNFIYDEYKHITKIGKY